MAAAPAWAAAVLCGGRSRRMGRDKALLVVDGVPMVRRVVDAARTAGASSVLCVGSPLTPGGRALVADAAGVPAVEDRWPGKGPLGGIVTALGALGAPDETDVEDGAGAEDGPRGGDGPRGEDGSGVGDGAGTEGPRGEVGGGSDVDGVEVVLVVSCDLLDPSADAMRTVVAALAAAPGNDVAVPVAGGRRQWLHAAWQRGVGPRLATAFTSGSRAVHQGVSQGGLAVLEVAGVDDAALADADTPGDLRAAGRTWATLPAHGEPPDRRSR
jgi:molybdenum cofactor guanylyltransferase